MFHLFDALADRYPALQALLEPELRALLAAVCALGMSLAIGPPLIRELKRRHVLDQAKKGDSGELDRLSAHKESTPTLGGLVLFGAALASTCLWARLDERLVLLCMGFVAGLGLVGFADDLTKLRSRRKGLPARTKMLWQVALSTAVALYLYAEPLDVRVAGAAAPPGEPGHGLFVPFSQGAFLALGPLFIPLAVLVMTGASNAVNLTDGLDGLAAGCSVLVAVAFVAVTLFAGDEVASRHLHIPHVAGIGEVGVFLGALVGAAVGFLWFNCHPARIFMGDTGALPLGGALGLVAVLSRQEILLAVAGGVLVVEAVSVMLQVAAYKLWRRRIFLIAPLHHHFQFKGLSETQITVRFWMVGALLAVFSLATLKMS